VKRREVKLPSVLVYYTRMKCGRADVVRVRSIVWRHYRSHGRHDLSWRRTTDPYRVLVSEIMLQQTQVARVLPKYDAFVARFPDVRALAEASLRDVLVLWSGLGYNRRARMLHETARVLVQHHDGVFPASPEELQLLPGIGPYTAGAVCVFAHNAPVPLIETNVRTVLFHHLLTVEDRVSDALLLPVARALCPRGRAREWHWALMDYGAHLKAQGVRMNHHSAHYSKQSRFEGSDREVRGAIVRVLARQESISERGLLVRIEATSNRVRAQLKALHDEGIVERRSGGMYSLPV